MVVLNRIYTRTGDDGTTSLGTGARRKKYDLRISAYGTVDEANAVIGLVRLHTAGDAALDAALDKALGRIQNDLFDVEADLCLGEKGPGGARAVEILPPARRQPGLRQGRRGQWGDRPGAAASRRRCRARCRTRPITA